MATRFRKSVSLGKGAKLNISKKSVGVSLGGKHGGVSLNSKTGTRARVSAPGTGLSYSQKLGGGSKKSASTSSSFNPSTNGGNKTNKFAKILSYVVGALCAIVALLMFLISSYGAGIVMALVAVLMFALGKNYAKQQEKQQADEQKAIENRERFYDELRRTREFKVVGVAFDNDDGKNRQKILKEANEGYYHSSALNITEYEGKPAVQVLVDDEVCGYIAKGKVKEVMELMPRAEKVAVYIDDNIDESDEESSGRDAFYSAVVHIVVKKEFATEI